MAGSVDSYLAHIGRQRSRAIRREGQRLRSLNLKLDKLTVIKAAVSFHGTALTLFTPGQRNLVLRAGFQHIGEFFVSDYLPLRFDRGYARAVLFYRPSRKYEEWKARAIGNYRRQDEGGVLAVDTSKNEPLVLTGALRESALNKAYAVARAANGRAGVVIRIPTPATADGFRYSNNKEVRKVLRSMPMKEVKALANRLQRFVGQNLKSAKVRIHRRTKTRAARVSMRLQPIQREVLRDTAQHRTSIRARAPQRRSLRTSDSYVRDPS